MIKVSASLKTIGQCGLIAGLFFAMGCASNRVKNSPHAGLFQSGGGEADVSASRSSEAQAERQDSPLAHSLPTAARDVRASKTGFIWPIKRGSISSFFGHRSRRYHDGIDIRAPRGTPIFAAKDGLVIYSSQRIRGYGNMAVVKHHDGTATVYAHAQKLIVRRGEKVRQGQVIAYVGSTGHATGPHLHFEVRSGRVAEDPLFYLPGVKTASDRSSLGRRDRNEHL